MEERVLRALRALPEDFRREILSALVEGSEAETVAEIRGVPVGQLPDLLAAGELFGALHDFFEANPVVVVETTGE